MSIVWRQLMLALLLAAAVAGSIWYLAEYRPKQTALQAVSDEMVDPWSARFRNVTKPRANVYCGEVNAKNRMGAYTGFSRFAVMVPSGGKPYVVMDDEQRPSQLLVDWCGASG